MSDTTHETVQRANAEAWDLVAAKYAPDIERDVARLRAGASSLLAPERAVLDPLLPDRERAIHLQCSHGTDTLSLWRLGARHVIGLDFSEQMLMLARRKSDLLGASATWIHADVLAPPPDLASTADLVYTGKGALPWISNLDVWARAVVQLLMPRGYFYCYESHPLNWVWATDASEIRLRDDADYFARTARINADFPASFLERTAPPGTTPARAFERQWGLGEIVSALAKAGLVLIELTEHAEHFWPQFPRVPASHLARLPHAFSLLMRRDAA